MVMVGCGDSRSDVPVGLARVQWDRNWRDCLAVVLSMPLKGWNLVWLRLVVRQPVMDEILCPVMATAVPIIQVV